MYSIKWSGPRHVCRLSALRRRLRTQESDWIYYYDGYLDSITIPAAEHVVVLLFPGPEKTGKARNDLREKVNMATSDIVRAMLRILYDEHFECFRKSVTIMYPLVVRLPELHPSSDKYLPAIIFGILFANNMITSEDLRQLSRIARILGSPLHGLRLYCDASIEGLQDVIGCLRIKFPEEYHIFGVSPINQPMPTEVSFISMHSMCTGRDEMTIFTGLLSHRLQPMGVF